MTLIKVTTYETIIDRKGPEKVTKYVPIASIAFMSKTEYGSFIHLNTGLSFSIIEDPEDVYIQSNIIYMPFEAEGYIGR
jgi:hypothetical protein